MFFPLGDENPRRSFPVVTSVLITLNAAVFVLFQMTLSPQESDAFTMQWGFDPRHMMSVQVLTSMFLHGGFMHLIGNMWVLAIVGDNVEDRLGRIGFLVFYLVAGAVATWTYGALAIHKGPIPEAIAAFGRPYPSAIGASGAIYGVMGMYMVFFPHAKMRTLVFWMIMRIPAFVFFGLMILMDVMTTTATMGPGSGGVATAAHAGGGVFGVLAAFALKRPMGGSQEGTAWEVAVGWANSLRPGADPFPLAPTDVNDPAPPGGPVWSLASGMGERGALAARIESLVRQGRVREAIDVYPGYDAMGAQPPLTPEVQITIAHEYYRQGLPRQAVPAYRRYLDLDAEGAHAPEAALRLGALYAQALDDADSAVPWYRKAAQTHPDPKLRAYAMAELQRLGA
jgi:membrane associated rhomboid family serine protease